MQQLKWKLAALAAAALVAACGGESADGPSNKVGINAMVSFGDSLSDIGSYKVGSIAGLAAATGGAGTFTVNDNAGISIWTQRIAALLPVATPCPAQTGLSPSPQLGLTGAPFTAKPGCTNYAQGSSRVSSPYGPQSYLFQAPPLNQINLGFIAKPFEQQVSTHLAAVGGSFNGRELVTVLVGANDIFMELAAIGSGLLTPQSAITNVAIAGSTLGQLIKSQVVGKGAKYVLVINLPYLAGTPVGQHMDAQTRGLVDTMTTAFNAQLAAQLAGVPGVILGDFYSEFKAMLADPAQYALTNVSTPVCGPNALSNPPSAPGTSLVCNASNVIRGDISHYAFADEVNPSPYGHQLLSQFASKLMAQAGWL